LRDATIRYRIPDADMKTSSPSSARNLWDSMTRAGRRTVESAPAGFHESSLELQHGLEVQEMPMAQLPADTIRQLLQRRASA
jgi:hypothetical protein